MKPGRMGPELEYPRGRLGSTAQGSSCLSSCHHAQHKWPSLGRLAR